jgi:hypothetical protein
MNQILRKIASLKAILKIKSGQIKLLFKIFNSHNSTKFSNQKKKSHIFAHGSSIVAKNTET